MSQSITRLLVVLCVALTFVTRAEAVAGGCLGDHAPSAIAASADSNAPGEDCHTGHHAMPADMPDSDDGTSQPHDESFCQCLAMVKAFAALPAPLQPDRGVRLDRSQPVAASFVSADPQPGVRPPIA